MREELPAILKISRASFFGYRSGRRPISNKAWRKLREAEKAAGINPAGGAPSVEEVGRPGVVVAGSRAPEVEKVFVSWENALIALKEGVTERALLVAQVEDTLRALSEGKLSAQEAQDRLQPLAPRIQRLLHGGR